jgi:hypothetical protein
MGHVYPDASDITPEHIAQLTALVKKRAGQAASAYGVDDIVGDILLASVATAKATGLPIMPIAFTNAKRERFYERGATMMMREAPTDFTPDDEGITRHDLADDRVSPAPTLEDLDWLKALSLPERTVALLVIVYAFTLQEAAEMTGISKSSLGRHLVAAKATLKAIS